MDSFEFNKIFAAILMALLVAMIVNIVSDEAIHSHILDKNVYIIDVIEEAATGKGGAVEEKIEPITPLLVKASTENGEALANKLCSQCHTFKSGEANKTGPNLFGIVGNTIAHMSGFAYSKIFQEKHGKENWDEEKLNIYLHKPRALMPGTKMAFAGIKKETERADVIKYLGTLK